MRLVIDTDVVVAAMRSNRGASFALIEAARHQRVNFAATVPLCFEYESVCYRLEHRQAAELSAAEVDIFVSAIIDLIEPVEIFFLWRPQLRDPGDELVLEAAVNARADAIVTFNRRDYLPAAGLFGLEVMLPKDVLRRCQ
jgi:putative PIN family toxin of toxin-antitoxin system